MNLKLELLNENEKERWNRFVSGCAMGSVFQSCEWGIEMERRGWTAGFPVVEEGGEIIAGGVVYSQKVPVINRAVVNIPNGPLWQEGREDALGRFLDGLITHAGEKIAIFIDCRLYRPDGSGIRGEVDEELAARDFNKMPGTEGTYLVDLRGDEDGIFKNFSKNHRRDIRKGEREGVIIGSSNGSNARELSERFYRYYSDTFQRKGLVPLHEDFFREGLPRLITAGRCRIFFARFGDTIYNLAVISLLGVPAYTWGASIPSSGLPPMGQLLHWEIIRWLKKNNHETYNLGGAPGDIPRPEDPNYWVWRFKKGFGGRYVEALFHYRRLSSRGLYALYEKFIPLYRRFFSNK